MEKQTIETNVVKPKLSVFLNDTEYRLITLETENQLDTKIYDIEQFMSSNDGLGKPDSEKDALYGKARDLWSMYAEVLRDAQFSFYLNRKQYKYITTLINEKLEYDVNTVFFAIELTNMLGSWIQSSDKHKDDKEVKGFIADATEITYIYHLISKHTVKGLSDQTYLFAEILRKIGEVSKIINYYDTAAKNLSKEIQEWVASFEPEEAKKQEETVQAVNFTAQKKETV